MKKYKNNVIPFPTKKEIDEKKEAEYLNSLSNECVEDAHFLLEVLEEFIKTGQVSEGLVDMNFRDETVQEARDMFVIVNLLNSMFNRYYGLPHGLHQVLDSAYIKVKEMIQVNELAQDDYEMYLTPEDNYDNEIIFTPDFDLDPPTDEDPDDIN